MKYNLPKPYLSNSAYTLWKQNKEQYRKKYYLGEDTFETAETVFGRKVADDFEQGTLVNDKAIIYHKPEHEIAVELDEGLKILGKLDGFDPETLEIIETKTGHLDPKGRVPWNDVKVRKHKQLVFYSLLVFLYFGKYNPLIKLQWLETRFKKEQREFNGHILETTSKKLELTGRIEIFERNIEQWELDNIKEDIIKVAEEISNDYTLWQQTNG